VKKANSVSSWKFWVLLAITLVAAFLRLYQIERLPPGDSFDPARYGEDALRILDGWRPVFLPTTDAGREPLYSYWVTLWVWLLGVDSTTLHIASALVGILSVPAIFLVGEELFLDAEPFLQRYGGLFAALTTALSYWHLNLSRYGVRAILIPLFAALTLYCLWRAIRTESHLLFAVTGVILGLSGYTYQVARLLPVLVVLAFLLNYRWPWLWSRRTWIDFLLVALVAVLLFSPLGYYFLKNPGSFTGRVSQTYVFGASDQAEVKWAVFRGELAKSLLYLNFRGDTEYILHTLPGRPALNPFLSVLFFLGLLTAIWSHRRFDLFMLGWFVIMYLPSVLSFDGPNGKRLIGTFPVVMLFVALGAGTLWRLASNRRMLFRQIAVGLLVLGLGYTGVRTYHEYFVIWGKNPDLFVHFLSGYTVVGEFARELPTDEAVYVSPPDTSHPSFVYNSGGRKDIKGYNGRVCLVLPEQTSVPTNYIVVPGQDENTLPLLEKYFAAGSIVDTGPLYYGKPYFLVYRIPPGTSAQIKPDYPAEAVWGDAIRLLGYDLSGEVLEPGETLTLYLYYQTFASMETDYTAFVHLWGPGKPAPDSTLLVQDDSQPCRRFYPTSDWAPGEIIRDQVKLTLPADPQPGTYYVQMGFYEWPSMVQLPLTSPAASLAPLVLQTVEIHP
jgi:hypothetical protein